MKLEPLSSPRRQMRVHIHSRTLVIGRRRLTLRGSSTLQRPARGFRRPQEGSKKAQEVSKTGTVCPLCFTSKLNRTLFRRNQFLLFSVMFYRQIESDPFQTETIFAVFPCVLRANLIGPLPDGDTFRWTPLQPPAWPRRDARSVMVLMDTNPTLTDTNGH